MEHLIYQKADIYIVMTTGILCHCSTNSNTKNKTRIKLNADQHHIIYNKRACSSLFFFPFSLYGIYLSACVLNYFHKSLSPQRSWSISYRKCCLLMFYDDSSGFFYRYNIKLWYFDALFHPPFQVSYDEFVIKSNE